MFELKKKFVNLIPWFYYVMYFFILSFSMGKAFTLYTKAIASHSQQILVFSTPLDYLIDIISTLLVAIGLVITLVKTIKIEKAIKDLKNNISIPNSNICKIPKLYKEDS